MQCASAVWAMQKCRSLLLGIEFELVLDHKPLIPIFRSKRLDEIENPRLQRLRFKASEFCFTVSWRRSEEHQAADALSRSPVDQAGAEDEVAEDAGSPTVGALIISAISDSNTNIRLEEVRRIASVDSEYQLLVKYVREGMPPHKHDLPESIRAFWYKRESLAIDDGVVVCGCRLVIPRAMRHDVLTALHASHQGQEKTKARARLRLLARP